ncbi:hypothetical protein KRR38_02965 [Novosphingobium sp. G106]|uniref:hypothetical protein n=1 Tax=Novosphingobium sp. G106 TaxID=2849500 RepID=UPI001C2DBDC7|nr:hypothetical protein [Novosphingobium sp. G106]MBV1686658.1 hypothetical protein [Novosphingobium sp. G106]
MTNSPKQPTSTPASTSAPTIAYRMADLPRRPATLAPNPYLGPHFQEPEVSPEAEPTAPAVPLDPVSHLAAELSRTLQLSRAGALGLTRLQLAIKCGDRHAAMAAMDRLHAVDAEMERIVERLPQPGTENPAHAEWQAIARHLADQKLSLAFEKLAMVSEISGPDMVSRPKSDYGAHGFRQPEPRRTPQSAEDEAAGTSNVYPLVRAETPRDSDEPPLADWPRLPAVQPTEWNGIPAWLIGLLLAVLVMVAIGTALATMA